jgi:hypothetical protein
MRFDPPHDRTDGVRQHEIHRYAVRACGFRDSSSSSVGDVDFVSMVCQSCRDVRCCIAQAQNYYILATEILEISDLLGMYNATRESVLPFKDNRSGPEKPSGSPDNLVEMPRRIRFVREG